LIDLDHNFAPTSSEHWLGTDEYGRDVLARALRSSRISLGIGLTVASISMTMSVHPLVTVADLW
jgi:peptide/nickel transport system permease protein